MSVAPYGSVHVGHVRTSFAPKMASAATIAHAMSGMPERASVYFSSTSSLFGAPGQGNYAAANAALEAFASSRSLAGLSNKAIQWGAWATGRPPYIHLVPDLVLSYRPTKFCLYQALHPALHGSLLQGASNFELHLCVHANPCVVPQDVIC